MAFNGNFDDLLPSDDRIEEISRYIYTCMDTIVLIHIIYTLCGILMRGRFEWLHLF